MEIQFISEQELEIVNERVRKDLKRFLVDCYFNWQEQIPKTYTDLVGKELEEISSEDLNKVYDQLSKESKFNWESKNENLVKYLLDSCLIYVDIEFVDQTPRLKIDIEKIQKRLESIDDKKCHYQKVRFIQILMTYTILFYIEVMYEVLKKEEDKEKWHEKTASLSSLMYGLLHLMRPIVKSYRDKFKSGMEMLKLKKTGDASEQEIQKPRFDGFKNIIHAKTQAIITSISGKFKYGTTITSPFTPILNACLSSRRVRRGDATSGNLVIAVKKDPENEIYVFSVEDILNQLVPLVGNFSNEKDTPLATFTKYLNYCFNHFRGESEEFNGQGTINVSNSSIKVKNNPFDNIIFWNGSGMTIPKKAHLSYAFNRPFPYVDIFEKEKGKNLEHKHLVYEENAWNTILLATPNYHVEIEGDAEVNKDKTSGIGIFADQIKQRSTVLKGENDFEVANLTYTEGDKNKYETEIHIQLPFLVPKSDPLTEISHFGGDTIDIVLTTS